MKGGQERIGMTTPFNATPIRAHSGGAALRGYREGFDICWVQETRAPIPGRESLFAGRAEMWRPRGWRAIKTEKLPW
jgi:hypothetical protein